MSYRFYVSETLCVGCFNNPLIFTSEYSAGRQSGLMDLANILFEQEYLCYSCLRKDIDDLVGNFKLQWFHEGHREGRRDLLEKEYDLAKATAMSKAIQKRLKLEESK